MNEILRKLLFLPPQGSTIAREIDGLHYFVILVTMAGAAAVTLVGGYFLSRYRRGHYGAGEEEEYAASALSQPSRIPLQLEMGVIAGLLALFLLWWFIGFRQFIKLRVPPEDSQEVYVVAKKWMWTFAYPEGGGSIGVLYVPADRPVKLVMTSRDVIHSFFVPDFRIKQDVVPGRYTTAWFQAAYPGRFDILCAEYCGAGHSTMRGQVVALSAEDYARWLEGAGDADPAAASYDPPAVVGQEAPPQPLAMAVMGQRKAAEHGCLRCHSIDGSRHIGPTWAGMYGHEVRLSDGSTVVADEAYLTESMMDPGRRLHEGFANLMPVYLGLVPPGDTAAIVEYIKSLRAVRPQEVPQ